MGKTLQHTQHSEQRSQPANYVANSASIQKALYSNTSYHTNIPQFAFAGGLVSVLANPFTYFHTKTRELRTANSALVFAALNPSGVSLTKSIVRNGFAGWQTLLVISRAFGSIQYERVC